ncbi:MAG: carboxypeptidase-like regulatory domain-containing protein [Kofleriaceae bacterium]
MNAWLRRGLIATLAGVASLTYAPVAHAQIAAAIGKPLPSSDLPAGTLTVRVIAGKVSEPVVGTDVTLVVNGTPRQARTDAGGRAAFTNLPAGATVQAKIQDEDKKDVASEEFQLSADSGERLMLSTRPFEPMGGGGAPFAGGGATGGMPDPRQITGQPRPEANDQPGTYTVRLTYDDLADKAPPHDVPVFLVGYQADDKVVVYRQTSDAAGRVTFKDLDRTGATSYFAMAELPRGTATATATATTNPAAVIDRLVSTPAVLDSRGGVRLILSGDKRASTGPAIDDITRIEKQENAPEAGKIRVLLMGVPETNAQVALVAQNAAGVRRVIASHGAVRVPPDPKDIQFGSTFSPKPDIPAHGLRIQVHGGANQDEPMGGVSIRLVPASAVVPGADLTKLGQEVKTPDGGLVDLTDPSVVPLIASVTINGKELESQPFDLTKGGGVLDIEAHWDGQGKQYAEFDSADIKPDEVVFAESTMRKQLYRSVPFQPLAGHGTKVTLYIYPRIMFTFEWSSRIDDEFLAVGGKFDLTNNSWAPYVGSPDGLIIPLPAHFKGARVNEQDQDDVAVAQDQGLRIGRPIPPGGKQFHAQFSMPIEHGEVDWKLDLPLGAFQSGMEIQQTPGMSVHTPAGVHGRVVTVPQGTYYVLSELSILPHQSMQMTISNLPSQPAWKTWAPRLVGLAGLIVMLSGLGLALYRTSTSRTADTTRADKKNELLDELVELEKSGQNETRRAQIASELERLWVD